MINAIIFFLIRNELKLSYDNIIFYVLFSNTRDPRFDFDFKVFSLTKNLKIYKDE